ncbi:MAG: hypothetical protein Q8K55_13655 [Gemmatimonadaceae bacterium]|nr:hypothetical protein [Gemmatimonadaceae bacterium]
MTSLRLLSVLCVAGVVGCSLPMVGRAPAVAKAPEPAAAADTVTLAPPIVQVRDFWRSSVVSVFAWEVDDAAIGLRAGVSRNGTLAGVGRLGDHQLYMTPFYAWYMGGFAHATAEPGKPLLRTGWSGDAYACFYGSRCTPIDATGVRIPDALLRANRDSLVVTFHATRNPWTITLRRELIAAFLATVDSVVAETSKTAAVRLDTDSSRSADRGTASVSLRAVP